MSLSKTYVGNLTITFDKSVTLKTRANVLRMVRAELGIEPDEALVDPTKRDIIDRLVGLAAFHGWQLDIDMLTSALKKDETNE